jgi:hypothetical protein
MSDVADSRKRWDTGKRFAGVADASALAGGVEELAELARRPGWVTEEPEVYLAPHLRDAGIDGLQLVNCQTTGGGVLAVTATYHPGASRSVIRRRAWALLGTVAEPAATVREHAERDAVVFEMVTGIPDGGPFASHGHSLRLTLSPAPAL